MLGMCADTSRRSWSTIAALVAAFAAVAGAVINWVSIEQSSVATRDQIRLIAQGQNVDRLQKANDQLKLDNPAALDSRLAGIDAFGLLARDDPAEYQLKIIAILAAFVQGHSPLTAPECPKSVPRDIQTALTVIGGLDATRGDPRRVIDLSQTCLNRIDLHGADLVGVDLTGGPNLGDGANLYNANLCRADLTNAKASGAHFLGANLQWANLTKADLRGADLRGADLRRADLRRADLRNALLDNANINGADFQGANLTGASLGGINIHDPNLAGASGVPSPGVPPSSPPPC